jgi:hypothetical protein
MSATVVGTTTRRSLHHFYRHDPRFATLQKRMSNLPRWPRPFPTAAIGGISGSSAPEQSGHHGACEGASDHQTGEQDVPVASGPKGAVWTDDTSGVGK